MLNNVRNLAVHEVLFATLTLTELANGSMYDGKNHYPNPQTFII